MFMHIDMLSTFSATDIIHVCMEPQPIGALDEGTCGAYVIKSK